MASTLPRRVDVLIVGAGPTGLAAALALHKQGCKELLIVDSVSAEQHTSRALIVHSATLEALDEVGCAEPLIKAGTRVTGGKLWDGHRFHPFVDFSLITSYTRFPFVLIAPQHTTERILGERVREIGIAVRRPYKVANLRVNAQDTNLTDVVFEDGQVVQARYVIGADGSKSVVRQSAGVGYADPDGEDTTNAELGLGQAIIADVTFKSPPPVGTTELLFILSSGNFFMCIPLPPSSYGDEQVWRIATGAVSGVPPHAPDTKYLQGITDAYGPQSIPSSALPGQAPLTIEKTIWSSRFRTHSAIADTPFTRLAGGSGPIVLIGDAAHLHPPAGGQGMNLGLRDAIFLGPVLAEHLRRSARATTSVQRADVDRLLKQWAETRHARALKVISLAKGILGVAGWKDKITWYCGCVPVNWVRVRNLALWLVGVSDYTRRMLPWNLSGLGNR